MKRKILFFIIFMHTAVSLLATSYSAPVKQKVSSSNGAFYALIDPDRVKQQVYKISQKKKAYWTFDFIPEMNSWFIPDNGEFAVCIKWRFVRAEDLDEPAVIVFRKNGIRKDYSYNSLVKARRTGFFEKAPVGSFWRVWYESLKIENNSVIIITNKNKIVISGDNGELNINKE